MRPRSEPAALAALPRRKPALLPWLCPRAPCVKLRLGPFLPAECIRRIGKRHAGQRSEAGLRLVRSEAARLRPGDQPRTVRRRAGAARPRSEERRVGKECPSL